MTLSNPGLRRVGCRITADGKAVVQDLEALSVYSLEELLTSHALTFEREQHRRSRQPARDAVMIEVWYR